MSLYIKGVDSVGYPDALRDLVGRKLLFKVVSMLTTASADSDVFRVRGICDDDNILAMYGLPCCDLPPEEVVPLAYYAPVVDLAANESVEFDQSAAFASDLFISPQSIGSATGATMLSPADTKRKSVASAGETSEAPLCVRKRASKASKK
ncbi:hypothetical protein RIF29_39816 [Crotalaria pallida]|uniref:Uncharacterized protein n=1 Tax=Crotalaria pallida TaxID=3830 RepID=A0AAN9E892_CROPI